MRIVDQSAAFWSGYVEISNKTIETDPNVLLSESMIRDRGEMFREWSALTTEDIIDCSKTEEQWGMSDLRKDLKASTQMQMDSTCAFIMEDSTKIKPNCMCHSSSYHPNRMIDNSHKDIQNE